MLIRADRFSTLPEGCPVWQGETFGYYHSRRPTKQGEIGWMDLATTEPVDHEDLTVDLTTAAAVRAFAPALICAVKGLKNAPKYPPAPVWDDGFRQYVLLSHIDTKPCPCNPDGGWWLAGSTPEACLLNGLKAALDAAKETTPA